MSGAGHSCSLTLTMTLTHQGTTFAGSYNNAVVACDGQSSNPVTETVVNGTVNGDQVSFDLDTTALHQTGTLSGTSMSGRARLAMAPPRLRWPAIGQRRASGGARSRSRSHH
jgi:hypothetical protein